MNRLEAAAGVQELKDRRIEDEDEVSLDDRNYDPRSLFPGLRDQDRILYSSSFFRLAGVTQIQSPDIALPRVHNRLTHSLKVSQLARSIALKVIHIAKERCQTQTLVDAGGVDPYVAAAAGMAHDLGHPPFGHAGERQLDALSYQSVGVLHTRSGFEGNAQTFRIAVKLESSYQHTAGLNLSMGTLAGILKYPWGRDQDTTSFRGRKFGYYLNDSLSIL